MPQEIDDSDLILISDSGKPFLIKMKQVAGGHEPASIAPLDAKFQDEPLILRDAGATLAVLPDAASTMSGCTCVLLNMESLAGVTKPKATNNFVALVKARRALRQGGGLRIQNPNGDVDEVKGETSDK